MTRQKTTYEQWASAKARWESGEKITFGEIGALLGISKQAVARKAKDDRWQKRLDLPKAVNLAYQAADRATLNQTLPLAIVAVSNGRGSNDVDDCRGKNSGMVEAQCIASDDVGMTSEQREEAAIIAKRAEVLARHRQESNAVRSMMYDAIRSKDRDVSRLAKMCSETLQIIQSLERKAWGLDKAESLTPNVIVIDRG